MLRPENKSVDTGSCPDQSQFSVKIVLQNPSRRKFENFEELV